MSRKKIIAGNWKMFKTLSEAELLVAEINNKLSQNLASAEVWIAPPALYLPTLTSQFSGSEIQFGAQDISKHQQGAYTGEISAMMLQSVMAKFTLVGHSERRQYHHEDDVLIGEKIHAALSQSITPVYCCGETLQERNSNNHFVIVEQQITTALANCSAEQVQQIVIAYEPVWAIGTGVTASAEQAQEMHAFIRSILAQKYGASIADTIRILYGGSVKPNNASELFSQPDIDGGLIGGASLVAADFIAIIESAI
jgi:triosephosphate isomerase